MINIKESVHKHLIKQMFTMPTGDTAITKFYISASAPVKYYASKWQMTGGKLDIQNSELTEAEYTEAYLIYTELLLKMMQGIHIATQYIESDSMDAQQYNNLLKKTLNFMKQDTRMKSSDQ